MEKQAQEAVPGRAAMPSMQPLAPDRKQWPMLIGALAVLGLGAFITVKAFAPSPVVETPVAVPAMAIAIQPVAAATGSSVSKSAQPVASESAATIAPYLQTEQSQTSSMPPSSGAMPISYSTNGSVTTPVTEMAQAAPVYPSEQNVATAEVNLAPSDTSANAASNTEQAVANAPSQNEVAQTSAEPEYQQQAPPVPRTPPDKSYLDKTTFKLGRQADSSKDRSGKVPGW